MQTYGDVIVGDYTQTLEDLRDVKLADLATLNDAKTQAPFTWDFGSIDSKDDDGLDHGAAGAQTLQMRVDPATQTDDPKNWLGVQAGASMAIIGGAPSNVIPIKATSNLWVQTSALQLTQVLATGDGTQVGMLARQSAILARYGALKAAIGAASDEASLQAIDITQGWPD